MKRHLKTGTSIFIFFTILCVNTITLASEWVEDFFPGEHATLPFDITRKVTNPASLLFKEREIQLAVKRYSQQGGYEVSDKNVVELRDSPYYWLKAGFLTSTVALDVTTERGREHEYRESLRSNTGDFSREKSNVRLNLAYALLTDLNLGVAYESTDSNLKRINTGSAANGFATETEEKNSIRQYEIAGLYKGLAPFYPTIKIARLSRKSAYTVSGDYNRYHLGLGHVIAMSSGSFRSDLVYSFNNELVKTGNDGPLYVPKENLFSLQLELNYPFAIIDQSQIMLGLGLEKGNRNTVVQRTLESDLSNVVVSLGLKMDTNFSFSLSLESSKIETGPVVNRYKRTGFSLAYSL
jgi:hypothetical protein